MKELNDNFEKQWREQFEDAERAPGKAVWDRIDASLSGNQLAYYKKKLFYYKWVAAASILLALTIGTFSVFNYVRNPESQLAVIPDEGSATLSEYNTGEVMKESEVVPDNRNTVVQDPDQQAVSPVPEMNNALALNDQEEVAAEPTTLGMSEAASERFNATYPGVPLDQDPDQDTRVANERVNASQNDAGVVTAFIIAQDKASDESASSGITVADGHLRQESGLGPLFDVPYEKPGRKYTIEKKVNPYDQPYVLTLEEYEEVDTEDPTRLWAGVNFSSGFFDPNISYGGQSQADRFADMTPSSSGSVERVYSNNVDIQDQASSIMSYKPEESSYQSDITLSYGLDFGYKFSKRFVLISGLGYQQNYGSTSVRTYIEPAASNAKYANHAIVIEKAGPESGLSTYNELNSEVQLNSTFEFVTIPVNIGYYLIDKKIKWLMTAGMSTDIFIKNTIDDSQNMFDPISYRPGDDSPYNPIYFNGKLGTMIHYTFSENYQISLEPSYRIGMSSLTKDNAAFNSRPSSFLISAGFSYVF